MFMVKDIKTRQQCKNPKGYITTLYYIIIIIGILGILDTLVLIPFMPGIGMDLLLPALLGIVMILFAVAKLKIKGSIIKNKVFRIVVIAVVIIGMTFFFVIEGLIIRHAVMKVKPEENVDYIMVLGCGIFPDGSLTLTLKNRLDAALAYSEQDPDAIFVVTGGQGPKEPVPEAQAMKEYLLSKGVPTERILSEPESSSTNENMKFSRRLIIERYGDSGRKVAIATSDFHMFRSKLLARHYGFDPYGIPGETPWFIRPNSYLREFLAVVKSIVVDIWMGK